MLGKNLGRMAVLTMTAALTLAGGATAQEGPIKVGFAADLTGACGALSEDGLNGAKIAAAEINEAGGVLDRQLELIVRDTQTKPDEGAKVARQLITDDKIDVLTGVCSSAVMLAESAVSAELKTPFYAAIGSTQRANIELFQPYFWQVQANATMEAYAAAEYVAKHPEWKRISFLGSDYEWGHTSVAAFTERLKELRPDMELAPPTYAKVGETSMAPYITATLNQSPDAVFAPLFGPSLGAVLKQGQGFGFFQRTALITLVTVDTLQSQGNSMPDNVYGIARAPFFALEQTPEVTGFVEKYRAEFNEYPTDWAVNAYDGLKFYAEAVRHAGTTEADAVIKALGEVKYDGLRENGLYVRALDGQMNAPVYMGKVTKSEEYGFPILTEVEKFEGAPLMPAEDFITAARAAAK